MKNSEKLIPYIDYTTLSESDTPQSVADFASKAMQLHSQGLPRVASICVYPSMIESLGLALGDSDIAITAVCGGFPAAQTYLEVKMLEVAMAIENGADEVDLVMNPGLILSGNYDQARAEIENIVREIDGDAILKVILETGVLATPELIHRASMIALNAGADFIKTSTGKTTVGATPEAARSMCRAIKEYHNQSGRMAGLKVSGGITEPAQAEEYLRIVGEELGTQWQTPELFRIGASRLLDNLI